MGLAASLGSLGDERGEWTAVVEGLAASAKGPKQRFSWLGEGSGE